MVLEFTTPPPPAAAEALYGWYFRHVLPRIGQLLARNSTGAYNYLPESVGQFPQDEALVAHMQAAGLANVRRWPLTFGIATLYMGEKGLSAVGYRPSARD